MRLVETDHVICFNQLHGLFGTRLRYVVAPYTSDVSTGDGGSSSSTVKEAKRHRKAAVLSSKNTSDLILQYAM